MSEDQIELEIMARTKVLRAKIREQSHTIQQLMSINRDLLKSLHDSWQSRLPEIYRLYQMGDDLAEGRPEPRLEGEAGDREEDSEEARGDGPDAA